MSDSHCLLEGKLVSQAAAVAKHCRHGAIPPAEAVNYSLCPLVPKGAQVHTAKRTCNCALTQGQVLLKLLRSAVKSVLLPAEWDNAPACSNGRVRQFVSLPVSSSWQLGLLSWSRQFVRLSRAPICWSLFIVSWFVCLLASHHYQLH